MGADSRSLAVTRGRGRWHLVRALDARRHVTPVRALGTSRRRSSVVTGWSASPTPPPTARPVRRVSAISQDETFDKVATAANGDEIEDVARRLDRISHGRAERSYERACQSALKHAHPRRIQVMHDSSTSAPSSRHQRPQHTAPPAGFEPAHTAQETVCRPAVLPALTCGNAACGRPEAAVLSRLSRAARDWRPLSPDAAGQVAVAAADALTGLSILSS
jgi:hypothetical protein